MFVFTVKETGQISMLNSLFLGNSVKETSDFYIVFYSYLKVTDNNQQKPSGIQ